MNAYAGGFIRRRTSPTLSSASSSASPLSGEDIQKRLQHLASRWDSYRGSERGEAQTFLNELIACYGRDRFAEGVRFEDRQDAGGILDMHWPGLCIVEMKAPSEAGRLDAHRAQALNYWRHSDRPGEGQPAAPYVVLCAFQRFEVWEPGRFPSGPRDSFSLTELPDRYEALLFLSDREPLFVGRRRELTTEAAKVVVDLYEVLRDREAAPLNILRSFVLQAVWCLFAENLNLLPHRTFTRIVDALSRDPARSSAAELGHLFAVLNEQDNAGKGGVYAGAPYANGGLFADPTRVHLTPDELMLLAAAAAFDWKEVSPTIFGSLMEGCLGRGHRWEIGAHYTHEADILKIVGPSIIEPWRHRIEEATTIRDAEDALADLVKLRVLDPACGCGNFLYVAYREIRELEQWAHNRIRQLYLDAGGTPPARLPSYPISNLYGVEVDEFAVLIARVTLWMGHKLAADAYGLVEPVLPLVDLSGIQAADALRVPWPAVDVIIGNPPFNGSQHLRRAFGDEYVEWLKSEFGCGVKDYCVYWFRRASDNLAPGGRAGLVGTNSVSQNRARSASLDYLINSGGVIVNAISSQDWPGEAVVEVSIVNWVQQPTNSLPCVLDGVVVPGITSSLRVATGETDPIPLAANQGRCFQGPSPVGEGFIITELEAKRLLGLTDASYSDVVRRFLTADAIADDPQQEPTRWIIDFGTRPLEGAMRYPAALAIVRDRVKPERDENSRKARRVRWWQFGEKAVGMHDAVAGLPKYIVGVRHPKRLLFCWCQADWCPNDSTVVFAFSDAYSFGVLSSRIHSAWARMRGSTLRVDPRYTPTSAFVTFPWPPAAGGAERMPVAMAALAVLVRREELCREYTIGLTELYNRMDEGAHSDFRRLHENLDRAIAAAYGWPSSVANDEAGMVHRLSELNRAIAAGEVPYDPFPPLARQSIQPVLELNE